MKRIIALILLLIFTFSMTSCGLLGNEEARGVPETDSSGEAGFTEENTDTAEEDMITENSIDEASQNTEAVTVNEKMIKVTLYFPTIDNSAIKNEEREVSVVEGAILKACILALAEGPESPQLRNPIPDDTVIRGISIKDKVAVVDFSKEFQHTSGLEEITTRLSVVNTLTGIEGVDKVRFRIEGEDMIGPSGMPLGDVEPVQLDAEGFPVSGETRTVTLYFSGPEALYLAGEKRDISMDEGTSLEKAALTELIAGPVSDGLWGTIPKGTKLLDVSTKNGVCTINFSKEYVENSPGGTSSESMAIYSVVNTLTGLEGIEKVQFLIEGEKQEIYTHAIFDKPFVRNETLLEK